MLITPYLPKIQEPTDPRYTCSNTGGVEHEVGEFLYGLVRMMKPLFILETGTHWGISASYMAAGLKDNNWGKIITIELDEGNYNRAKLLFSQLELTDYVKPVNMAAENYDSDERRFDLIWLDTEPHLRFAEFIKFVPLLNPGGFIFIHDLGGHMSQTGDTINGITNWPFGDIPEEIKKMVNGGELRPFHFATPRGLTGFYKVADKDYQWR